MIELLDRVYGDVSGFAQVVVGSFGDDKKLKIHSSDFFEWPTERDAARTLIDNNRDTDVYLCTSVLDSRKRGRDTAKETNAVCVDADECVPESFRIPPSLVVETSPDRYHAYWFLDETVSAQDASDMARRICIAHKDDGCDPSGWPMAKLLRVPNTTNTKRDSDVRVVSDTGTVYSLDELAKTYSDIVVVGSSVDLDLPVPDTRSLPTLLSVVGKLDMTLLSFYKSEPDESSDWSSLMWRFIQDLFRFGLSRDEVFVLAQAVKFNKYERDGRPVSLLWAEVMKAESVFESNRAVVIEDVRAEVLFLRSDERASIGSNFVDDFEVWVYSRSPLASRKYSRFVSFFVLSNVYGSWVHITPKIGDMKLNLWGLMLGPSSSTKKTTVADLGLTLLREWEGRLPDEQQGFDLGSDFTPEGLNAALATRDGLVSFVHRDEVSGFFHEMFTKSYLSGGVQRMTALYDGRVLKTMRATRNASQQTNATTVFNFLGLGIEQHTASVLSKHHFQSGFLPRFIWCVEDEPEWEESRERVEQQSGDRVNDLDPALNVFCNQFHVARRKWDQFALNGSVPILMDDETLERFNEFSVASKVLIMGRDDESMIEPSRLRLVWTVWKCAALLAIHESSDQIELHHLLYVLREAETWFADLIRMASLVADSDFAGMVNEVEDFIASRKGLVDAATIYRKFNSYRKGEVDELLLSLVSQGRVYADSGTYRVVKG
jgi:hypothetical protein